VDEGERSSTHVSMKFLLNYSNPTFECVSDAFALSEAHAEHAEEPHDDSYRRHSLRYDDCMAELFPEIYLDFSMDQDTETSDVISAPISLPASPAVQRRIDALISLLMDQYERSPTQFPLFAKQTPGQLAAAVFTEDNISEYVSAFFNFFHPHTPFIHRPSFNTESVSIHILLSILLVGSIFCTPQDHALSARSFFGLAEEYVFSLLREVVTHDTHSRVESITIVQSAVLIHALQVNSNHEGVRHRVRVNRFPEIVASLRCLGLFGIVRAQQLRDTDWTQYIIEETQIRYVRDTLSILTAD
jgi:hypothetical protein